MNYIDRLKTSAQSVKNCACMGLDPQLECMPECGGCIQDKIITFFNKLFSEMKNRNLSPAAFKPNIGYYAALDKPRQNMFEGSQALAAVFKMLNEYFPNIPIILDSKRGDIARSSLNYAIEAFDCWEADAVTVSPYMGSDSIFPFISKKYEGKGAYILNRTSNAGAADFQNLQLKTEQDNSKYFFTSVTEKISEYAQLYPGTGAVAGATGMDELKKIANIFSNNGSVPLLIPGVGSQGGSAQEVLTVLKECAYDLELVRINSSSALTHPWKTAPVPENYLDICIKNIENLIKETYIY